MSKTPVDANAWAWIQVHNFKCKGFLKKLIYVCIYFDFGSVIAVT